MVRIGKILQVNTVIGINFFKETVDEFVQSGDDPRIIIVNTNFAATLACTLYDAGLYGPKYVFLWTGLTHPQPNSPYGPPGCTGEMIAEIARSVIIFSHATPLNLHQNMTDALGMSPEGFEEELKLRIGRPDVNLDPMWFPWRSIGYNLIVGAALVVEEVHNTLKAKNDSILNWLANSDNFNNNGSFIHEMFKNKFQHFKYNGLETFGNVEISKPTAVTGFFQMQQKDPTQWTTESFEIVPVATYDANTKEFKEVGPMKWLTFDGNAPFDASEIIEQQQPLVPAATNVPLLTISAILIVTNLGIIFGFVTKENDDNSQWSKPFNVIISVGNVVSLMFLIPFTNGQNVNLLCMAGSVCLIVGQTLLLLGLFAKLQISNTVFTKPPETNKRLAPSSSSTLKMSKSSQASQSANEIKRLTKLAEKKRPKMIVLIAGATFITLTLAIVWVGIAPIKTEFIKTANEQSQFHPDVFIHYFSYACAMETDRLETQCFIATLIILYLILLGGCLRISVVATKILKHLIDDINRLRLVIFFIATVILAGGAIVWMMFISNPLQFLTAVSILNILIVISTTWFQLVNIVKS